MTILFIHSLADKHLNCFQLLAVIYDVAVNIHTQILYEHILISLGWKLRHGIVGACGECMSNFMRKCQTFP